MSLNKWIIDFSSWNNQLKNLQETLADLSAWILNVSDQFKNEYLENQTSEGFWGKEL